MRVKGNEKPIIYCLAVIMVILGWYGYFAGGDESGSSGTLVAIEKGTQSPLGDLAGIVVDDAGRIYCGVQFYSRIHVYDDQGNFLYGLPAKGLGGIFRLRLDENNHLNVATVRNRMLYVYNENGELIKQEKNEKAYDEFGLVDQYQFVSRDNVVYRISNPLRLFPRVEKITPDGSKTTLVTTTLKSWLVMGPFPACLFIAVGMGTLLGGYNKVLELFGKNKSESD